MIDIKPHQQNPGFCGPSCLKMVLEYYGVKTSEEEMAELTKCNPGIGLNGKVIVRAAKKLGFSGFTKDNASLKDIRKYIKKEIPVIIEWFSHDESHFSVVVGIDEKYIYIQDPELAGMRRFDLESFNKVWFNFDDDFLKGKILRTKKYLVTHRMVMVEKKDNKKRRLLFFLK